MNRLLLSTCFPLLLSSCAGHIAISPEKCTTKARWAIVSSKKADFNFEYSSWTLLGGFLNKEIKLKEILEEQQLSCQGLQEISITARNGLSDKILGITPLLTTKTYRISGRYKKHGTIRKDTLSRKDAN